MKKLIIPSLTTNLTEICANSRADPPIKVTAVEESVNVQLGTDKVFPNFTILVITTCTLVPEH